MLVPPSMLVTVSRSSIHPFQVMSATLPPVTAAARSLRLNGPGVLVLPVPSVAKVSLPFVLR